MLKFKKRAQEGREDFDVGFLRLHCISYIFIQKRVDQNLNMKHVLKFILLYFISFKTIFLYYCDINTGMKYVSLIYSQLKIYCSISYDNI